MAKRPKAGDAEILREAKERFERCVTWESPARANALADARFAAGDSYNMNQWDTGVRNARGDRPMLTNNLVRQHNLLIVNDQRQNKAAIKITPTGGKATFEAAQIFSGIIRRIEYQSKAIDAYSTAAYHQVESGIGYVRVVTDWADEESFDQDIFIRRVANPRTVYLDPDATEFDKGDMRYAFIFDDVPRDQYEAEHGKGDVIAPAALDNSDNWNDKDHVRVAEYWRRNDATDTLHLLTDGSTKRESDMEDGELDALKPSIVKSRDITEPEIEWFKLVGDRVDERKTWLGKYIPIVPWIGEEIVIEGKMDRKGHTRAMLDAQRMDNYWSSAAVEFVALQSKSPYIGTAQAVEGYEDDWATANTVNRSVLLYNGTDDAGQPIPPPARSPPPVMPQAYIEGMKMARDDLMQVSGQHEADMGMPGNERSGKAIDARQRQGDRVTYHYIDNQAKGIRQVGRICLDLIPKIYDTARVVKILGEDGSDSDVALVPNAPDAHQHVAMGPDGQPQPVSSDEADALEADKTKQNAKLIFNPNVGLYDCESDVSPAYSTQRQEAANAFSQIMAQNKEAFAIVGDFWAQNSDFPGADELAERLKKGLPPQYRVGPDPQVQQIQQAMQQQGQHAQSLLQKADAEVSSLKAQVVHLQEQMKDKARGIDIDDYKAETERLKAIGTGDPGAFQVIIRSMLSDLLGMPALPIIHEHAAADAAHAQSITAPDPNAGPQPPDPMAMQQQQHGQEMDRAKLGLQAQQQAHAQALAVAQHGLAVQQAQQPQAPQ